jgi:hypothetical protein
MMLKKNQELDHPNLLSTFVATVVEALLNIRGRNIGTCCQSKTSLETTPENCI